MGVRMAGLKRTKSGLWTSRKVIPSDVRAAYGKTEEKPTWPASLSPAEARAAYGEWLGEVEGRVARFRSQAGGRTTALSQRQAAALAARWYEQAIARRARLLAPPQRPLSGKQAVCKAQHGSHDRVVAACRIAGELSEIGGGCPARTPVAAHIRHLTAAAPNGHAEL